MATNIKQIKIGIPEVTVNTDGYGVVDGAGRTAGQILVNDSATGLFKPSTLLGGYGITTPYDGPVNSITINVDSAIISAIAAATIDSGYIQVRQAGLDSAATTISLRTILTDSGTVTSDQVFETFQFTGDGITITGDNATKTITFTAATDSAATGALIDSGLQNLSTSIIPVTDSTYDLGDSTRGFRSLYLSGQTIYLGNLRISENGDGKIEFINDSSGQQVSIAAKNVSAGDTPIDSALVTSLIDSAHVQARQITYNTSDFTDSAFVTGLNISTFHNDVGYLDSTSVFTVVDSAHLQSVIDQTYIRTQQRSDFADSAFVTALPISTFDNDRKYLDSNSATSFVDSAYIQARQTTYTNVSSFVNDANYLDSTTVQGVIDSSYIQSNQITYNTSDFADSAYVTGLPISTFTNDANYLDSNTVTSVVDSTYILANAGGAFLDSASAESVFDSAYVQLRARKGLSASGNINYDDDTGAISFDSAPTMSRLTVDSATLGSITLQRKASAPTRTPGTLYFDSDYQKGITFIPSTNEGNTSEGLNLGQEHVLYVHNQSGALIENGSLVYIAGVAHGSHPSVAKAQANDVNTYKAVGMATMDIADDGHGYITQFGIVDGINTDGLVAGGSLFLSADSAGKFVTTEPGGSNYPYRVGWALTIDSAVGRALIRIDAETADNVRVTNSIIVDEKITADSADLNLINIQPDLFTDVDIPNNIPWPRREGDVFYFSGPDALTYSNPSMNVKLGQDEIVRVYNNSGSDIAKGKVVYITGAANDFPSIALSQSDDFNTVYNTIGLTGHAIANGQFGFVVQRGLYGGLNTVGFTVGSRVHVSPDSAGELVDFSPGFPNFPYEVGTVLIADSAGGGNVGGCIQVEVKAETFENVRVQGDGRFGGNVTISGNLNILGTETKTAVANLSVADNFIYIGAGDTVTTLFSGTGTNDATIKDYYEGDSDFWYFVNIYDADSANGGDLIRLHQGDSAGAFDDGTSTQINFDSAGGSETLDLSDDLTLLPLRNNLKITFETAGGHDSGSYWYGLASPVNQDLGIVGNYNLPDAPYSHAGFFRDASDQKFKVFNKYDPEVSGDINTSDPSFTLATMVASTFEGNLTGNVTGNASTATLLQTARNISISGDITGSATSFDGGSNIAISSQITAGSIVNADISGSAAIADTKLATISTASKVSNSATTATSANTASAIVARDGSGNFSAGTITASITGTVSDISNHTTDDLSEGSTNKYYDSATTQLNARNAIRLTDAGGLGSATYSAATGILTYTGPSSADVRGTLSVTDAGGDGSLTYDNSSGIFTYTGPSASDVRAHLTANKGLSVTNGEFNIDSANVRGMFSAGGDLSYNSSTGEFTFSSGAAYGDADANALFATRTTDSLGEGSTNLYYTTARANSDIDTRVTAGFINNLSGVSVASADSSYSASRLAITRLFGMNGAVSSDSIGFDGQGNVTMTTTITAGAITSTQLASASTLLIKDASGSTLKTIIGAGV